MKDMESEVRNKRSRLEHLQYLNVGLFSTIRFSQSREGLGILNQSIGEHKIGMLNVVDVVRDELDRRFEINWSKVDKMIRYHDVGEIKAGEIPITIKTEQHRVEEQIALEQILEDFPGELGAEISEILREKEEHESVEARIVHAIDKIEPQIIIATKKGVEELREYYNKVGVNMPKYQLDKYKWMRDLLIEWELEILVDLLDETWERQVELGILDEDPQLKLELETDVELNERKEKEKGKESQEELESEKVKEEIGESKDRDKELELESEER